MVTDMMPQQVPLPEYRKYLRRDFNLYSHCSNQLCTWNLFFNPRARDGQTGRLQGTLDLNIQGRIINCNAHAIDAFETAHILEFIELIRRAYSRLLASKKELLEELDDIEAGIARIMEKHNAHRCQEVRRPPEVARLEP